MLTFKFSGADGVMTVTETLTSGMVGKQVKFEFTTDWDNLTKTAVFEAGDISEAVYNVGNTVDIPAAVLEIARRRLKIGIYGEDTKGNITPTIYAIGPRIEEGADPYRASGDPPMPKWKELEKRIEDLENGTTGGGSGSDSGQNVTLTTAQINALDGMFKVCAYDDSKDVSGAYAAFMAAFGLTDSGGGGEEEPDEPVVPEVTLASISATYSGGDVAVGTAVTDLTGIVVTAHYSDGTSETVTGYTLSGEIAEGENVITVAYDGKATTFTVIGVAESGGEDAAQYGLHIPSTNTGTLDLGVVDKGTTGADTIILDAALPTVSGLMVYFKKNSLWVGVQNSNFGGTWLDSSDKTYADVAGNGRQTVTFSLKANNENASTVVRGWSNNHPEMTIYGIKMYAGDTLLLDIKPTATLGEMYDTVKGTTFTWSDTTGMNLEVA